ncbi:CdaR family transcriptional regulator [Metabacillus litoralis]|uniref:PucR family transcriptional regulator n=1 Tax=Metabacillus TaxID=2675233 RepID=UPI00203FC2D1|nr:PucR family transcriptional regulator [Metabacillus litoralis]MCM3161151.1 PucR family transcriptional regulator [Metabacillus litoralis]
MTGSSYDPFKYHFERLEDVAEKISEVLQCPITIEDVNHRLLAYSTHDDRTDQARISTIIGRRVPEKVINSLWKDGTIPKLLKTDEPIRVKTIDEVGLGNRIAISIWKNDEVLGFIWALEIERHLQESDLLLLKKAAQAVKNKMLNLQVRKNKKIERNQEFFWKLLTGHISTEDEITDGLYELNLQLPSPFSVVIFKFPQELNDEAEKKLTYLLQTTQQVNILLFTIDFDELIILLSGKSDTALTDIKQFTTSTLSQLHERYSYKDVTASIGGIFTDSTFIEKSYKEALAVLSLKKRFPSETSNLNSFSELGFYQYLDILFEQRKQTGYIHYPLYKLKEYDKQHGTDLVRTLEVFLDHDSNVHEASKALNIHINTLNYRLKRISEIAELNLKNMNQKITIYLNLKLDRMSL